MDGLEARRHMVRTQIEARGIRDRRVLDAMVRVPRERFVRPDDRAHAFEDAPLPIGHAATISQPYIVALMTEALCPQPGDRVLEVGTGSGYQCAVLAELGAEVHTVEIVPALSQRARAVLEELEYRARFRVGDGREGWPEAAPFAGILVTAAPLSIPPALVDQLSPDGRLVLPVGSAAQDLLLIRKTGRGLRETPLTAVRFVPLLEEPPP